MLKLPVTPLGKWIMNEDGLKIYDGLGILIDHETDIEKANTIGTLLFKGFKNNSEGTQTYFESDELKKRMETELDHYNSHCTVCEKELPKKYYSRDNMNFCGKCYKKRKMNY